MKEKKKKKEKKAGRVKAADVGLEGFVDWGEPIVSVLIRRKRTTCLALPLDSLHGCVSGVRTLWARLPPAPKVQAINA